MYLGHKWLALILGRIIPFDRWCTNQTTCNYRKRHRLRPLNLIWCRVMRHLTVIPWLSSVMFRVLPTSRNRSGRRNRDTKTELEHVAWCIFSLLPQRSILNRISDCAPSIMHMLNIHTYIHTHIHTHTRYMFHRNSSPTLEITFATYCGNSSHYDESWMMFFLFTQEIPAGSKYSGDAMWNRNKLRASKTSKMNIWTEIKHVYTSGYLRNKIEIFSLLYKILRAKRKTVSMYFMFVLGYEWFEETFIPLNRIADFNR